MQFLRYFFGVLLCILSLTFLITAFSLLSEHWILIILPSLMAIGFAIGAYILLTLNPQKSKQILFFPKSNELSVQITSETPNEKTSLYSSQSKRISPTEYLFYLHHQVQRQGIQVLESLDIIDNTSNIDTLIGRIDFVNSIYENLLIVKDAPQYQKHVQIAIDTYKSMYYNKVLKDYQISLLLNPNISHLEKFYGNAIYQSFKRFEERQAVEMSKLKRVNAIESRRENIIKVGYSAKYIFKTYSITDYDNNLDKIEEIRKKYKRQN